MGESSARSLRGGGMEDVIFAGTTARPARDFAEVTLTLDNRARTAPVGLNDDDVLEVTRRIERRSEEHTSELQSLMRISYAVFCLQKKQKNNHATPHH